MEHTQSVVERAYAFVEDILGLEHIEPDRVVRTTSQTAGLEEPDAYTFQSIGEIHVENRRRPNGEQQEERMGTEKAAAQEHEQAAERVDRAKRLAGQALGEIEDISRGMKESTKDGKKTELSPAEQDADHVRRDG